MRVATSAKWVAAAAVVALGASACGSGGGSSSGGSGTAGLVSYQSGEPQNPLQPANANEVNGGRVLMNLFRGLTQFTPDGKLENAVASSIQSSDSKHYTVTLKPNWTFTNGEKVTSDSFIDAWNWAAQAKNAQANANWFSVIQGYSDVHPASGTPKATTMSGLKKISDTKFDITLNSPISYFNYELAYTGFSPLPKAFFKDPKAYGQKPVGNGPYKFDSWTHNNQIVVKKWSGYQGSDKPQNDGIVFKNYSKADAAYQDLLSNNLDLLDQVDPTDLGHYKKDLGSRAIDQPMSGIQTIAFAMYNSEWKGVNTAKVRQGLSMAINRPQITKTVLQGSRTPSSAWTAEDTQGYKAGTCGEFCTYNPTKAKELIKAGGGVPGNKITVLYNADGGHKQWVDAVCNSITQATGVACAGDPKPDFKTALNLEVNKKLPANELFRNGWQADFPYIANFLTQTLATGADANYGAYSSPEFDALLKKGEQASSPEAGAKFYQQAEGVLAKDMPAIPLWDYRSTTGYSSKVSNVKYDWQGNPVWTQVKKS
ncbi:peptide ABC transporter substrate-binding protein [Mangrovactinospora gilvigrisea]|uniref:Peptide ABC transporter substrate-binding protein n=1 Tax=Mangrovactinospora gilvigrisea TaxID=1428644 RepID=A0A1J7CCF6_9ACTN|nr:ABC transporter substrate-binding protein [Mangrovactinospora gilvigrisea]OIV37354.1 peptide ABC transporter substrate-binding protein [Mangrovactinospora gilvigrisea]